LNFSTYHFDKAVPSCEHGEKESKEKAPQKEVSAEIRRESDRGADR
jgi:hypothetical protein